jgi:hypothetical protein
MNKFPVNITAKIQLSHSGAQPGILKSFAIEPGLV